MTFLPLTNLHTERTWMPVLRYNVPMIRTDSTNDPGSPNQDDIPDSLEESVSRVAGYISAGDIYSSLKPELLRILQSQFRGDAYGEYRRIETRSHRKWLGMEDMSDRERAGSVVSDQESVKKIPSAGSSGSNAKRSQSERSLSVASVDTQVGGGEGVGDQVQLRKEVGAWWGRKTGD